MGKKWPALFSLLTISVMLLAACGQKTPAPTPTLSAPTGATPQQSPSPQAATPTSGPTRTPAPWNGTITIWHQWGGAYLSASQQIFQAYEDSHPGVIIKLEQRQNLRGVLKDAVLSGQGPDIVEMTNDQIGALALGGTIIDLGSLGVDSQTLGDTFEPAAVAGVTFQSKVWAFPESQQGIALVYNKALLTADTAPKGGNDFDDLLAKARDFAAKNSGKYLVCNQGFGNPDAAQVAPIFFGFGVPSYVDDSGKVYLNTPQALQAGEWLASFSQYAPATASYDICTQMFLSGKAAAFWTGPFAIPQIQAAAIDFGIIPMGRPFVAVNVLMITPNAVDRSAAQAALDVMKFFTNAQNAEKLALAGNIVPANTAALKSSVVSANPVLSGFGAALQVGVAMATTPYSNAQWGPAADAATAIWTGRQTPAEALAAAQKAIEDGIAGMK